MRIRRLPDESLVVQESWMLLRTGCAMGGILLPLLVALSELGNDPLHPGRIAGSLLGGLALLWLAGVVYDRRLYFDATTKLLTWEQRNWFRSRGGELSFSDIKDVLVTSEWSRDSDHAVGGYNVKYGTILVTETGPIPLTGTFGYDKKDYQQLADTILAVLAMPHRTPESEDEVSRAIAAGRMIEAVNLIRARKGLGLTEARNLADEIRRAQSTARKGQQ